MAHNLANSPDNQWVATPEPSTWAMMFLGFAGLGFMGWRGSRKTAALAA
jgi:PEP-CTERM motif